MTTILITGANRGIGLELAKQYAEAGWHVFACCRQPDAATRLHQLSKIISNSIHIFPLDVTDISSIQALKKSIGDQPIDILMNNAGILGKMGRTTFGKLYEASNDALSVFQVNALGPLFLSELLVDNIANSQRKTIVNISSDWGSIALNKMGEACLYRASKAALNSITATMAATLKTRDIKVVAIHPGWVQTEMGGPGAAITTETSVNGIMTQVEKLDLKHTGCYIKYTGEKLPW
jgi:NAD(P)-dependent dehydrogenase (short-subunit alcohol dehydrogenase family)